MADKAGPSVHVAGGKKGMDPTPPPLPGWFTFLRYGQFGVNIIVLVCTAIAISFANKITEYGLGWGLGFTIFTNVYTLINLGLQVFIIPMFAPQFYFKWIILGAECFQVLWWLCAWAGLAVYAAWASLIKDSRVKSYRDAATSVHGAATAGTIFGAFLWISFIVSLVFYSIGCHRARVAGRGWNANAQGGEAQATSLGPIAGAPGQVQQPYDPSPTPVNYGTPAPGYAQPQYNQQAQYH